MPISTEFKNAVAQNKLIRVRIMLKDNMVIDPTLMEFNEMIKYAESNMPDLYDEHDGENLNYNEASWTKDYMDKEMVILVNNFSKERINLLKKVVKKVYGNRVNNIEEKRKNENTTPIYLTKKQVGTGVAVGGAAVAVAGIVAAKTLIVATGVVVFATGIAIAASDK